jgi:hypothetical protein
MLRLLILLLQLLLCGYVCCFVHQLQQLLRWQLQLKV